MRRYRVVEYAGQSSGCPAMWAPLFPLLRASLLCRSSAQLSSSAQHPGSSAELSKHDEGLRPLAPLLLTDCPAVRAVCMLSPPSLRPLALRSRALPPRWRQRPASASTDSSWTCTSQKGRRGRRLPRQQRGQTVGLQRRSALEPVRLSVPLSSSQLSAQASLHSVGLLLSSHLTLQVMIG